MACLARYVLNLSRPRQREFLEGYTKKHGEEAKRELVEYVRNASNQNRARQG